MTVLCVCIVCVCVCVCVFVCVSVCACDMCVRSEEQMTAEATRAQRETRRAAEVAHKLKKFQDDTASMVLFLAEKKPA
jgi:hypothetical protein